MNTPTPQSPTALFRKYYQPLEPILKKPKNRVYTTTVLSFLTVSLFVWYAIRPTIQTILSLRREIRDSVAVNEQMETKISALVEAQAAYQGVVPKLGLVKEAIPESPEMVELLIQLRNLANDVNASISGANVMTIPLVPETKKPNTATPAAPATTPTATNLTVTVDGSYDSLKQFIQGIYSLRRIVTILDLSMVPHISESSKVVQSMSMSLKLNSYSTSQ